MFVYPYRFVVPMDKRHGTCLSFCCFKFDFMSWNSKADHIVNVLRFTRIVVHPSFLVQTAHDS